MNAYRESRLVEDLLLVLETEDGQQLPVSSVPFTLNLSGIRVSLFKAREVALLPDGRTTVYELLGEYEFIQPSEDQTAWEEWKEARVAEAVAAQKYLDRYPWMMFGNSKPHEAPPFPNLVPPGAYLGREGCLHILTRPGLRNSRFLAYDLHLRSGQVRDITKVNGAYLKPVQRLTSQEWLQALHRTEATDGSCRTLDHYRGCLLGEAVGDALGAAVNDSSLAAIRKCYGPHGIRDYSPMFGRLGAITAHTQMALFTAEGLIRANIRGKSKGICHPPSVVRHAYLRWMHLQGEPKSAPFDGEWKPDGWLATWQTLREKRSPSKTTLEALRRDFMGTPERAINQSKGCGALTRIAPIGLAGQMTHDGVFAMAGEVAALTYGHPTAVLAASFFAQLLAEIVQGTSLREAIIAASLVMGTKPGYEECSRFWSLETAHTRSC